MDTFLRGLTLVFLSTYCKGHVQITEGPQNVTALVGDTVVFHCDYSGTENLPLWQINGTSYSAASLPSRHQYISQGLQVTQIHEMDNNTKYICYLLTLSGDELQRVESPPAFLIVHLQATDSVTERTETSTDPTSIPSTETRQPTEETVESFTQSISSTMNESTSTTSASILISTCSCGATESTVLHHEHTSNVIIPIHPTTESYQLIPQITVVTVSGTVFIPSSPPLFQQKDNLFIIYSGIGAAAGITVMCSIAITVTVVVSFCYYLRKRKAALADDKERENIAMKPNAAYERPRQRFQMQRNEAYNHVHPPPRPVSPEYANVSAHAAEQ